MDSFHNTKGSASSSKQISNDKNIDADSMIKNIISQQDTFVMNNNHQLYSSLPKWMIPKSGFVHPLYEQIWQYVKSDKRDRTCDTNLVSQLLMTSGLPVDILGGLWSMANIGVEGSLSQQELYVILALITLVQNGYSVSNVSLLQHIHKPIIPQLNYALIEKKHNASTIKVNVDHRPQQETTKSTILSKQQNVYAKNLQQPNFNVIPSEDYDPLAVSFIEPKNQTSRIISTLVTNTEPKSLDLVPVKDSFDTFDDEFSDFQCAQFTNADSKSNHEFTDFQSAFDTLSFSESTKSVKNDDELINISSIEMTSNSFENQQNLISCEDDIHDKYEVFRTLAAETVDEENLTNENNYNDILEVKHQESTNENIQNYDDEFGDFLCVEEVSFVKEVPLCVEEVSFVKEVPLCVEEVSLCVEEVSNNKLEIEVDWKNVQVQCIEKCLKFLKEGIFTFTSITDERVLMEVINHDKGIKYLTQLNLISQICKRILKNCYCESLEVELIEILSKLEIFLNNITHESTDNSETLDSTKETVPCYLCKCDCNTDNIEYMLNQYHSSCINLLVNFIHTSQIFVK